ncbi:2-deoxy-D-gluconate 3-dehydrogenase [Rhodobacteraceae bacterium WD3A24]|nr:2-deoxy-D-gluconate 3-dehydrogenase [Rhodobacteraceae bacterium WD3A24]
MPADDRNSGGGVSWPDLRGRTALVTGGSSGLGRHFCKLLAAQGVAVTAAARRTEALDSLRSEIAQAGGEATTLELDVASADSVAAALEGRAFDIVVNNAGVTVASPALEHGTQDIDAVIDTNLKGAFRVAQTAARAMHAQGREGAIVNIASILGLRVAGHVAAYAASKAGLVQLTKALALEWARYGIRVNALCPGYIETPLNRDFFASEAGQALIRRIPQRRLGRPEDLDAPLMLLCSDAGAYMTGSVLAVDGGHLVSSL